MRLRTFSAVTLDEAITLVRNEMGEEAIIVSTYQSRRGRGAQPPQPRLVKVCDVEAHLLKPPELPELRRRRPK